MYFTILFALVGVAKGEPKYYQASKQKMAYLSLMISGVALLLFEP